MRAQATFALTAAALVSVLATAPAYATREHSFVASYGNDSNACSYLSPCASFQQALSLTVSGGEITAIDSDGFGPLNITQSVTITGAPGAEANVPSVTNGSSVVINGSGIKVTLRNLTINGEGLGSIGIEVDDAANVTVNNCMIENFYSADGNTASEFGDGIYIGSTSSSALSFALINSTVLNNSNNGIAFEGAPNGSANGIIQNVTVTGNGAYGIYLDSSDGSSATVAISNSRVINNYVGMTLGIEEGAGTLQVSIDNTIVNNNVSDGIDAINNVKVLLGRSVITGNGEYGIYNDTTVNSQPNTFYSYKDNRINGNGANTTDDEFGTAPNTTTHVTR
jgi:Right handed beta helix region